MSYILLISILRNILNYVKYALLISPKFLMLIYQLSIIRFVKSNCFQDFIPQDSYNTTSFWQHIFTAKSNSKRIPLWHTNYKTYRKTLEIQGSSRSKAKISTPTEVCELS